MAHGSAWTLRAACPGRRLGYIYGMAFRKCRTESVYGFHVCKKGFGKNPNPNPFFRTQTRTLNLFVWLFVQPRPLNGPWRQIVFAASRHNCRQCRQSGGFAPRPPFASGFGVRGSAPPCVGVVESPTQTSSPNLPPIFGAPRQKKWEPKGPQIKVKENDATAPLLFWHRRSCSVNPPAARPKARALARPLMRAYAALMHPRPRLLVLFTHLFTL